MKQQKLKALCAISFLFALPNAFSQNQQNKIDSTGNIGIGTMSPSPGNSLQVAGNTRIDSALEVRDTATFRRKVRIEEDVVILGKTFMRDHAIASQNFRVQNGFRVDGISHFYDNVFVDSTFRVEGLGLFNQNVRVNGQFRSYGINNLFGTSRFHDDIRLLHLSNSNSTTDGFLMVNQNGLMTRKDVSTSTSVSNGDQVLVYTSNGDIKLLGIEDLAGDTGAPQELDCSGANYEPTWVSEVGKLWTGDPCDALVGIGTNDPQHRADIRGVTSTGKLIVGHYSSDASSLINAYRSSASPAPLMRVGFYDNGQEDVRMELTSGGSLVLNHEDASAQWDQSPIVVNHGFDNIFKLEKNGALSLNFTQSSNSHPLIIKKDNQKILQLTNQGMLRARRIKIDQHTWADFVFEDDYKLMPILELDQYISTHGHLPGVATEQEVKEEGVDLAEQNKVLLQKVEELSLYVIQLKKEIDDIKSNSKDD